MRALERTILFVVGTIFLMSVILLMALVLKGNVQKIAASFPTATGYEYQFFEMRLLPADLPSGYVRRNIPMRLAVEDGVGEQYVYEANRSSSSVHLVQQIIIFPTVEAALERIQIEITEWPKFEFTTEGNARIRMPNADHLMWACSEPVTISGRELLQHKVLYNDCILSQHLCCTSRSGGRRQTADNGKIFCTLAITG